jgi:hypothetical protein
VALKVIRRSPSVAWQYIESRSTPVSFGGRKQPALGCPAIFGHLRKRPDALAKAV